MAVIADTSALYVIYDADDNAHQDVMRVVSRLREPLVVPMSILAEVDYLLTKHLGDLASLDFLEGIQCNAYKLEALEPVDITRCRTLLTDYRDLRLGLADASIMATAERLDTPKILTLDERHFRTVKPIAFPHFVIYPADYPNGK